MKRIKIKLQKEGVFKIETNSRVWLKDKTLYGQSIILDNISDHCGHILTGEESPEKCLKKLAKPMDLPRTWECYEANAIPYRFHIEYRLQKASMNSINEKNYWYPLAEG